MNFNEKVWALCRKIPKGRVTTYREIAEALKTNAYRAVGNALHANPYAPIVPCHRVVSSSGCLSGYGSNIGKRLLLLKKEGIRVKNNKVIDFEKVFYKWRR